jgi:hypothetical protein
MAWNISVGKISVRHYRNIGEFPYIGALLIYLFLYKQGSATIIVLYNIQNLSVYGLSLQLTGVVK